MNQRTFLDRFNYYAEGRAFEWVLAVSMLLLSGEVFAFPEMMKFGAFSLILLMVSTHSIGVILLILGWAKCVGLMLNGQKIAGVKAGPYIRAGASVLSSIMWGQFALALLRVAIERGRPAFVLPFLLMFAVGELYVAYTTVKNA